MEQFKKSLFEVYMNYDTLQYLKEENEKKEDIISIFEEELDYSKDLTSTLMKYDKSFLKSVAMRIKLKMKRNIDNDLIKNELLGYDETLKPLLEKLIKSNIFQNQYNNITSVVNESHVEEIQKDEDDEEEHDDTSVLDENGYSDIEENESSNINIFIDKCVKVTDSSSDFIKVSELYKQYCSFCDENDLEKDTKSEFKKWLASSWGKSSKGGYEGYKLK